MKINILTRTSNRPRFFADCKKSIDMQTYQNINHLISVDDPASLQYVQGLNYLQVNKRRGTSKVPSGVGYAPHNTYLNDLQQLVSDGWIMFLDDDDCFVRPDALEIITQHIQSDDDLIIWKVDHKKRIIPDGEYWQKPPVYRNISMPGFMFHSKYKNQAIFDDLSWADFKVAETLYKIIPNKIWINQILTGLQQGRGRGKRLDKI